MATTKTSLQVKTTNPSTNKTVSKTASYANPKVSNATLNEFAQTFYGGLSANTVDSVIRVDKKNITSAVAPLEITFEHDIFKLANFNEVLTTNNGYVKAVRHGFNVIAGGYQEEEQIPAECDCRITNVYFNDNKDQVVIEVKSDYTTTITQKVGLTEYTRTKKFEATFATDVRDVVFGFKYNLKNAYVTLADFVDVFNSSKPAEKFEEILNRELGEDLTITLDTTKGALICSDNGDIKGNGTNWKVYISNFSHVTAPDGTEEGTDAFGFHEALIEKYSENAPEEFRNIGGKFYEVLISYN